MLKNGLCSAINMERGTKEYGGAFGDYGENRRFFFMDRRFFFMVSVAYLKLKIYRMILNFFLSQHL